MPSKHCTSEKLLAYLDDELPTKERQQIARHLAACWPCRATTQELESVIVKLSNASGASSFLRHTKSRRRKAAF